MGFPKLIKKRSNKSSNSKSHKKKNDLLTAASTSHRLAMTKKSSSNVTDATTRSPTASLNSSTASLVVEDDYNDYDYANDDNNIGGVLESYSVRTTVLLNSKQLEKMKLQDEEHAAAASSDKSSATTATTIPMTLTSQEREWALAIKALLKKKDPTLASQVTDFEVAHHALIAKSKSNKALKRIQRLHKFRNDHGLLHPYQLFVIDNNNDNIDTQLQDQVEDAMKSILEFHEKSGGMFLAFGRTYPSGNHDEASSRAVALLGYNTFLPSRLASKEDWITCFQAYYYLLEAVHPHLAACRNGGDVLFECQNAGYHNFSFTMEKHAASLCLQAYPIRPVVAMVLHAPAIFKVLYKMVQPLLTQKLKQLLQLNGCVEQAHQHYGPHLLPTKLGGTQTTDQTMQAFQTALTEKYRNMATFRL